ncbi:MAG: DUF6788 family protein, partial [Bryobacteraceae bacterium]
MPAGSESLEALRLRRGELIDTIGSVGDMRPGSLVERFRKCGKPTCHCAGLDSAGHGPCFSLTQSVAGKTRTRILPKGTVVERARAQIAEYRRFRALLRELIAVSEQIADAELDTVAET